MKHRISRVTAVLVSGLGLGLGLSQTAVSQVGSQQRTFEEIVVTRAI